METKIIRLDGHNFITRKNHNPITNTKNMFFRNPTSNTTHKVEGKGILMVIYNPTHVRN